VRHFEFCSNKPTGLSSLFAPVPNFKNDHEQIISIVRFVSQIIKEPLPLLNLLAHSKRPVKLAILPLLLILPHARNKIRLVVGM
jgi:hypothetical protein